MGVNPARHLIHTLVDYAIRHGVLQLSYVPGDNDGTLVADAARETFELIAPPKSLITSLLSELALLAGLELSGSESSGSFQLINTTIQSITSWHGDRPVDVDVSLWRDRFVMSLSYPSTPVEPIQMTLTWADDDSNLPR